MSTSELISYPVRMRIDEQALAKSQRELFLRSSGTARAVWNWALAAKNRYYDARSARCKAYTRAHATEQDFQLAWGERAPGAPDLTVEQRARAKQLRNIASLAVNAEHKARVAELGMDSKAYAAWFYAEFDRHVGERFGGFPYGQLSRGQRDELRAIGLSVMSEGDIAMLGPMPSKVTLSARFTVLAGQPGSPFDWWKAEKPGVNRFVMSSALDAVDEAFKKFFSRLAAGGPSSRRKGDGRPDGWPRFKRADDRTGFAIFNVSQTGVVSTASRINVPSVGNIRVHGKTARLRKLIERGAVAKSARFTYQGDHWWVTVLASVPADVVNRPVTKRQRRNGAVGVDLGVALVAATSGGAMYPNPRVMDRFEARKRRAEAILERTTKKRVLIPATGRKERSAGRIRAAARKAKVEGRAARVRESFNHQLTKELTARYEVVVIEDLKVANMLRRAVPKPDPDRPGQFLPNGAAAKSGLSRSLSSVSPSQIRQQLEYKSRRYGSEVIAVPAHNTSRTCAVCGHISKLNRQTQALFACVSCGHSDNADFNAAKNILARGLQKLDR